MEDNEIAAKRHKKRKTDCFYAPFASFRGYSLFRSAVRCRVRPPNSLRNPRPVSASPANAQAGMKAAG